MTNEQPANNSQLCALCRGTHPGCVVCSPDHPWGLRLRCGVQPDGGVQGEFNGSELYAGYEGRLHGGLIAALLDGAMTQCLFAQSCQAFTAELTVRYRHPVAASDGLLVRAWLVESRASFHRLRAELRHEGRVMAFAVGKFMEISK